MSGTVIFQKHGIFQFTVSFTNYFPIKFFLIFQFVVVLKQNNYCTYGTESTGLLVI